MKYIPNPELDAKISILYQTGHSMRQIARRLYLSPGKVEASLKRTNTMRRSISEGVSLRKTSI